MCKTLLILPLLLLIISAKSILKGNVIAVYDGDTITLLTKEKKKIKIRLYGIDCPEKKQAFGTKAKQFASDLVYRQDVEIISHDKDRYGRIIGEVLMKDGRSLNKLLVEAGYAWWYKKYSPNNRVLDSLEQLARSEKRGLWKDKNPVPPWEFRRGSKKKQDKPKWKLQEKPDFVIFNKKSKKYHCLTCRHAIHCTKNCIQISESHAVDRGGKPCKVCGGRCEF